MSDPVFRKLQQQLDQYSLGFPASKSGVEIQILEKLFSIEDARVFLEMTPRLETPEAVAPRLSMDTDKAASVLENMAARGLLFSLKKNKLVRYGAIPFVHGIFEFQVNRMDRKLAELVRSYMNQEFKNALSSSLASFLRVIPVRESIDVQPKIADFEDAIKILEKADPIVITDCVCRKSSEMIDDGCGKPLEVCFMFGSMGRYYLDHGMGRKIGMDEAKKILANARDNGLVTQPATSRNPSGMCNCCGDCCGPLSSLKDHPKPAQMVFSNHFALVDQDLCTGCEACLEKCQMDALPMEDPGAVRVNLDRCIGCGLCVTACPVRAITLEQKSSDDSQVPPRTSFDQMVTMAQKRGLL